MSRDLWEAKEYIPTVTSLDEAFSVLSFSQYEDLGLPIDLTDIVGSLDTHQEWFESLETLDKALTLDSVGALPIETQWVLEAEMKIKGRVKTMSGKPHKPRKLIRDKNISPEEAAKKLKFEAGGTTYLWVDWRDGKVQVASNRPTPSSMHVCWVHTPDSPTPFQSTMEGLSNWLLLTGKTIPANLIRSPTELDMFITTTTAKAAKGAAQELEDCDWPYLLVDDGLPGMIKFSYDDNLTDYAEDPNNWVTIDSGTQEPIAPPPKPCPGPGPCPPPVPVSPMPSPGPLSNLFDAEYREEEVLWKQDFHSMIYTGSDKIFFAFRKEEPGVVYTIKQMSVKNQPMCRILHIWEPYAENKTPYDSYIQKLIIDHDLLNAEPDDLEPEPWHDPTEPWMEDFASPEGICLFCDETEGLEVINLDGWPEELCETCRDPEQYLAEEKMCHKCGHSIFTECVGCSNDICDECLQPQHLTTASGGEAFDSRVGWMCCPECYDENVDVEYTVRKDAEAESFSADMGSQAGYNISPYSDQEIADLPSQHGIVCSMCGYNKFKKSMATYNKVYGTTVYYPCNRCNHVQVAIFHEPDDGIGKGSFDAESFAAEHPSVANQTKKEYNIMLNKLTELIGEKKLDILLYKDEDESEDELSETEEYSIMWDKLGDLIGNKALDILLGRTKPSYDWYDLDAESFDADFDHHYRFSSKYRGTDVLDTLRDSSEATKAEAIDWLIDNGFLHSDEQYNAAYVLALGDAIGISDDDWDAESFAANDPSSYRGLLLKPANHVGRGKICDAKGCRRVMKHWRRSWGIPYYFCDLHEAEIDKTYQAESFAAEVIKKCQRCGGKAKMTWVQAKCSDLYDQVNLNTGKEYDGYVPDWIGTDGDYVSFTICRHCGQVQGAWPELDATMNQFKSGKANTSSIFDAESFAAYQLYHGRIIGNYTVSWRDFDENEGSAEFEDFNDALKYAEDMMKNPLTYVLDPNKDHDVRFWRAQTGLDVTDRHYPQEVNIFSNKNLEQYKREAVGGPPMVTKISAESFSATTSPAGTKGSGMSRLKADAIINKVKAHMGPHLDFIKVCGSYRRGNSTPKDLDFVVIPKKGVTLPNILPPNQGVNWVGDKKAQVIIDNETIDFRVSSLTGLGASLMYFTGPAGYNIGMRMRAKKMGLKLNEYGVFDRNTGAYIAGATEADVYQALGKPYKSPDLRGK